MPCSASPALTLLSWLSSPCCKQVNIDARARKYERNKQGARKARSARTWKREIKDPIKNAKVPARRGPYRGHESATAKTKKSACPALLASWEIISYCFDGNQVALDVMCSTRMRIDWFPINNRPEW
jgi:hypothetical protein